MSQQFRPNSMIPTVGVPGAAPLMYGAPQAQFSMAAPPSGRPFVPGTIIYPRPHISGVPNAVPLTAGPPNTLQRVYVPVQQMPIHPCTSVPAGQLPVTDPSKLREEQRKFEKERNFQWQQQRLKQFTVAGKKGSLNADTLLDSMFGKPGTKKGNVRQILNEKNSDSKVVQPTDGPPFQPTSMSSLISVEEHVKKPFEGAKTQDSQNSPKEKFETDPKKLENMMLQCSSLSGPQKAKGFQKPLVKEINKLPQMQSTMFSSSQKAINWSSMQGLENVFSEPRSRFPAWCKKEALPPLYQQVEKIVTNDGGHAPDTNLLFPILLSSGLSQKALGEIWELVNETTPGQLSNVELYATLALIAVAQAGHPIKDINILQRLPTFPIPVLQCFHPPSSSDSSAPVSATHPVPTPSDIIRPSGSNTTASMPCDLDNSVNVRPTSISLVKTCDISTTPQSKTSWSPFETSDSETPVPDDDFDDFKSATPVAMNAPPMIVVADRLPEDDFADFKQAEPPTKSQPIQFKFCLRVTNQGSTIPDLMLTDDDKYSVFRTLELNSSNEEISADPLVTSETVSSVFGSHESKTQTAVNPVISTTDGKLISHDETDQNAADDDEFGDFLEARPETAAAPTVPTMLLESKNELSTFIPDFADFTKLNDSPNQTEKCSLLAPSKQSTGKVSLDDSEFGDFATFQTASKLEVGQEYFFPCNKDSISLTETQSISSLELGPFDGILQNGESKSSLSRQGSVPSLDLRCVGLEGADVEDGFGELQSAITKSSKSPTPSVDTNKSSDEKSPSSSISGLSLYQPSILPLADKYSVIRSEVINCEDQNLSDWTRCAESCLTILQKGTRIFNQMSCSSVCNEVLSTEEGKNYVKNVIEVYRIICRLNLASKSYERCNEKLQRLIDEADKSFHTLSTFLAGSSLLPDEVSLDFSMGVLRSSHNNNEKACGVCLLNVDSRSRAFNKYEDINKLTYGGRQYHSSCANLWVNYVDPLLPVLTLPQLI